MPKVTMPQLGKSVAEGTIGRWLKQVEDHVDKYQPIVEVVTDKVNAEVPSPSRAPSRPSWSRRARRSPTTPRSRSSMAQAMRPPQLQLRRPPLPRLRVVLPPSRRPQPRFLSPRPPRLHHRRPPAATERRAMGRQDRMSGQPRPPTTRAASRLPCAGWRASTLDLSLVSGTGHAGRVTRGTSSPTSSANARALPNKRRPQAGLPGGCPDCTWRESDRGRPATPRRRHWHRRPLRLRPTLSGRRPRCARPSPPR